MQRLSPCSSRPADLESQGGLEQASCCLWEGTSDLGEPVKQFSCQQKHPGATGEERTFASCRNARAELVAPSR